MRRWRRAKSLLALCAAAFLMVGGSVMAAAPAQASVSAEVKISVTASPAANQPLANSGCYPSGLGRSYQVITFRTTSTVTGSFRAAVTPENGEVIAALYDGSFTPNNTVARCIKRSVGAAAGESSSIYWSAAASTDAADSHTWSLVLFADTVAGAVDAAVSVTSNGTVSIEGQPLTLQAEEFDGATQGEKFQARFASVNGTPPYKYSATGFPQGISIDESTGAVEGTPTEFGDFTPVITVTDSSAGPQTASKSMELAVAAEDVVEPTKEPTVEPTVVPTVQPTVEPTVEPTMEPTVEPTMEPTVDPTVEPTGAASSGPSESTAAAAPDTTTASQMPDTSPAQDKLPATGAAAVITAVVGALVLGAGVLVTAAMRRRRPRRN